MTKPTLPQETRDFGPEVVRKRGLPKPCLSGRQALRMRGFRTLKFKEYER